MMQREFPRLAHRKSRHRETAEKRASTNTITGGKPKLLAAARNPEPSKLTAGDRSAVTKITPRATKRAGSGDAACPSCAPRTGWLLGHVLEVLEGANLDDLAGRARLEHLLHLRERIDTLASRHGGLL